MPTCGNVGKTWLTLILTAALEAKCIGVVPGKAGKAAALPRFWKIEGGGGSGGAPPL